MKVRMLFQRDNEVVDDMAMNKHLYRKTQSVGHNPDNREVESASEFILLQHLHTHTHIITYTINV